MKKTALIKRIAVTLIFCVAVLIVARFWLEPYPTLAEYAGGMSTELTGMIITVWVLQNLFDSFDEKSRKEDERKKILRLNEIISIHIHYYTNYFYMITTPLKKRSQKEIDLQADFKISDLSDLHKIAVGSKHALSRPAIELFYQYEQSLRNIFTQAVTVIDFIYFPKIKELILDYIRNSLTSNVSDAIIDNKKIGVQSDGKLAEFVSKMLKDDDIQKYYAKYQKRALGTHVAIPYFVLYDLLKIEQNILSQYEKEIRKIKK